VSELRLNADISPVSIRSRLGA